MSQPRPDLMVPTARQGAPLLAVSATFTAEPVEQALGFWIEELDWDYRIQFAPYNQVFQQLLDSGSLLARNRDGVNVVLVRFEDWARFSESGAGEYEENARQLARGITAAASTFRVPLLVVICPASPEFIASSLLATDLEQLIEASLAGLPNVHLVRSGELTALYPVADYYDPHGDELGHIPFTPEFFAALGTMIARRIHAMRMAPYKVIVLDCDETLWKGVCGEDGPQGVRLDPGRRFLQEFMLAQRDRGMLLALASKNDDADVIETLDAHPEFPLRPAHFVTRRINWGAKSANLVEMAGELNLSLDSFIFVDDNPAECAELRAHCPEVLTLALPSDPERIPAFLRHVWAFDHLRTTEEDRRRAALYAQEVERGRMEKQAASLEEFLAALNLEVRIAPMAAEELPRVSQLTLRTNQMNFTCIRRTEAEVQELLSREGAECLTVDVSDRFGSYGLVGAMIFRAEAAVLAVDTFLLSCRALGRGTEHRMLARLGEIARDRGLVRVDVPFTPAARNSPALALLESIGAKFADRSNTGVVYRFPPEYLAQLEYHPNGARPVQTQARPASPDTTIRKTADLYRIATELASAEAVLERTANVKPPVAAEVPREDAPRTDLEKQLAAMWTELLGVPSIGIHDNFFDLGGHSLLAVQLLSRVRQAFGADLSLEVVYGGPFTIAELARAIDLEEIVHSGGDYEALLQELDGMSDEEVRALLAQESDAESRH